MIEVRLFATFREGRGKIVYMDAEEHTTAKSIIDALGLPEEEVAILLVNGRHSEPDKEIRDQDVLALFPPVGGG